MKTLKFIIVLVLSVLLCSCIKEKREECPCYLSLDFSKIDTLRVKSVHVWFSDSLKGIIGDDCIDKNDFSSFYEIEVPKGSTSIYCWGNLSDSLIEKIIYCSSDKLYFYKSKVPSWDEFASDTVKLKREYMRLNVKVIGDVTSTSGLSVSIESNTAGYLVNGEVIEGSFYITPEPTIIPAQARNYYEFDFNIIRQKRIEDLRLFLISKKNGLDTILYDYPLGETLAEMGVDMKAEELGDVSVIIDFSYLETKITIEEWNGTQKVEVII